MCTCAGCTTYVCTHRERWGCKSFHPYWLDHILSWGFPKHRCIILLHPCQSSKFPWCMPHHRAGVAHSAHFSASNCSYFGVAFSNFLRNWWTIVNWSYVDRSLSSIVTQHCDVIIMFQLSVVTSCSQFCHFSITLSEFELQELSCSHEILPSGVRFT